MQPFTWFRESSASVKPNRWPYRWNIVGSRILNGRATPWPIDFFPMISHPEIRTSTPPNESRIVRRRQYHRDNNELVELSVLRYIESEEFMLCGNPDASCDSNSADWRP